MKDKDGKIKATRVEMHPKLKDAYAEYEDVLRKDMLSVYDSLTGNMNRMCVTNDMYELEEMHRWARNRIDTIYNIRKNILELREPTGKE